MEKNKKTKQKTFKWKNEKNKKKTSQAWRAEFCARVWTCSSAFNETFFHEGGKAMDEGKRSSGFGFGVFLGQGIQFGAF